GRGAGHIGPPRRLEPLGLRIPGRPSHGHQDRHQGLQVPPRGRAPPRRGLSGLLPDQGGEKLSDLAEQRPRLLQPAQPPCCLHRRSSSTKVSRGWSPHSSWRRTAIFSAPKPRAQDGGNSCRRTWLRSQIRARCYRRWVPRVVFNHPFQHLRRAIWDKRLRERFWKPAWCSHETREKPGSTPLRIPPEDGSGAPGTPDRSMRSASETAFRKARIAATLFVFQASVNVERDG